MWYATTLFMMTAGTCSYVVGEQIDEFGYRQRHQPAHHGGHPGPNAGRPVAAVRRRQQVALAAGRRTEMGVEHLLILAVLFVLVVAGVVFMQLGQRQIPRKAPSMFAAAACMAGNRQYLPLRLNQSGVMPIIFASSLLMLRRCSSAG